MKRVIFCAVLMAWSTLASAVVYKWVDAQGKIQYGDRPPDGVHAARSIEPGLSLPMLGMPAPLPDRTRSKHRIWRIPPLATPYCAPGRERTRVNL